MCSSTRWASVSSPGPKPIVGIPSAAVPLPLVQNSQWPGSPPTAPSAARATGASAPVYQAGAKLGASTGVPV